MFLHGVRRTPSEATCIVNKFKESSLMGSMVLIFLMSHGTVDYDGNLPITSPGDAQPDILHPLTFLRYSWLQTNEGNVGIEKHVIGLRLGISPLRWCICGRSRINKSKIHLQT